MVGFPLILQHKQGYLRTQRAVHEWQSYYLRIFIPTGTPALTREGYLGRQKKKETAAAPEGDAGNQ